MNTSRDPCEFAVHLTKRSSHPVFKMAAVLLDKRGRIFAWGWNHFDWHAERHALYRANRQRLRGATLVVAGAKKSGELITSRPCRNLCEPLCRKWGIARVLYATPNGWREMKLAELESQSLPPGKKMLRFGQ